MQVEQLTEPSGSGSLRMLTRAGDGFVCCSHRFQMTGQRFGKKQAMHGSTMFEKNLMELDPKSLL